MAHIGMHTIYPVKYITWNTNFDFGDVSEVKVTVKAIPAGRDSQGRTKNAGYDIKVEFNAMGNGPDGINLIYNALSAYSHATLIIASSLEKITLTDVRPVADVLERDGNGQPSKLKITADKIVSGIAGIFQEI